MARADDFSDANLAVVNVNDRRLSLAMRIAAYRKRGSAEPTAGRCGRKNKQPPDFGDEPHRYCTQKPLRGRTACRAHGGKSHSGPASENFRHGLYSGVLAAGAVADGYLLLQKDEDLLTLREQIRLAGGRERLLQQRIAAADTESPAAWRTVGVIVGRMLKMWSNPDTASVAAIGAELRRLADIAGAGAGRESNWKEWEELTELRRRLVETETRILEKGGHMVSVERALEYGGRVASHAVKWIQSTKAPGQRLAGFTQDMAALADGRDVEDAEMVR